MLFSKHEQEEQTMFDQQRIGANIMKARKAKGLTQMALADGLNVSFQAVSNWERGQTCPDLSNLMELSRLLDISVDALLGNEREVPPAEPTPAAVEPPAETPKTEGRLSMAELATCAPFVSREFLNRKARQHLEAGCTLWELSAIAPFLEQKLLDELALLSWDEGSSLFEIGAIAPFLSGETVGVLVRQALESGQRFGKGELSALMPFLPAEIAEDYLETVL